MTDDKNRGRELREQRERAATAEKREVKLQLLLDENAERRERLRRAIFETVEGACDRSLTTEDVACEALHKFRAEVDRQRGKLQAWEESGLREELLLHAHGYDVIPGDHIAVVATRNLRRQRDRIVQLELFHPKKGGAK